VTLEDQWTCNTAFTITGTNKGSANDQIVAEKHRIRYDTRCYFNVRSKADMSQLNLPHGTNNWMDGKKEKAKK